MINIKYIKGLFILLIVFVGSNMQGQNSMSLYYLDNLPQVNYTNAASMPRCNAFVSIPSFSVGMHSDLAMDDLLQKVNGQWVSPLDKSFKYSDLYKSIGKTGSMSGSAFVAPLYFGFRVGKGYVTFSLSEKLNVRANVAQDLFKIAENGLPANTSLDLSSTGMKYMAYKEISLGYARDINEKLTLGVHLKPLFGQVAMKTKIDNFVVNTGVHEYSLNVAGNVYSSAPIDVVEGEDGFPDEIVSKELENSEFVDQYVTGLKNPGFAMDFGAVYKYDDRFSFSAAINNLGYIKWKEDLNSLAFNGEYKFTGTDVTLLTMDSIGDVLGNEIDSVRTAIDSDTGSEGFSTALSPSVYLGGLFKVNNAVGLGVLSRSTIEKNNFRQEFSLSANVNLRHFLTANISYNVEVNGGSDLGLGLALRGGPLQFYVMADHLPLKYNVIEAEGGEYPVPMHMESVSFMAGINFIFGANGSREDKGRKRNSRLK